jgi:tetratricopeptide (TPR) repeat protein
MSRNKDLSLVSIIIPTYNRSQLLRLTVESVLAQTYPNIEIIVVDDGSTDDTARVMEQYTGRITYIKQDNQGPGGALETGFQGASGEYINFLDHDDLMMPTKIERQVQVLDSQPEIGLVHCGYYEIDKDGNLLEKYCPLPEGSLEELACWDPIWSGAPLVRRQCLDHVRLFDKQIRTCDWDLWLGIAQAGYRFACVQEPLGAYRILPGSQASHIDKIAELTFATLDKFFADPHLPDDVTALKDKAYGGQCFWLSCKYYAAGRWEEGQRYLARALALQPQLLENPQLIYEQALNPRVDDPVKFIMNMFDHLPPGAESLQRYRVPLLHQVYAIPALRSYRVGKIAEAKRQLTKAITRFPTMLDQSEDFAKSVYRFAMRTPTGTPLSFVDTVMQNLPDSTQPLARARAQILGDVNIGCAFQEYTAGHWLPTIRRTITGLWYNPVHLRNRGVLSIFLKSLLRLLGGILNRTSSSTDIESGVPVQSISSPEVI